MSLRTLVVYGNCQADALHQALSKNPVVQSLFRVVYGSNFEEPGQPRAALSPDDVAACALLWHQHSPEPFPDAGYLPADCLTVSFPSVDLNVLWPFSCPNPFNEPQRPQFPWGQFPYGDRVILECIKKGWEPNEILEYYLTGWDEYKLDMRRLLEIERTRLQSRDEHCDVKMSEWVFDNFRSQRLFWTINHPTPLALRVLMERLLDASGAAAPQLKDADTATTLRMHFPFRGPLGAAVIPIHRQAAAELELAWYDENERYPVFARTYSYVDYYREMIEYCWQKNQERSARSA